MLTIKYEDKDIIVAVKPVGMEAQSSRGFSADMVSEIKKHIHRTSTIKGEPYVGVIHRLDKPVSGLMVYAKTKQAAAILSDAVQKGKVQKQYLVVFCGKPVDNVGKYVDYLLKSDRENMSKIVDKGITGGKLAELHYRVLHTRTDREEEQSLAEVDLITGRHHQIRVQFAGHGTPLWGDNRYNPKFAGHSRVNIGLAAWRLSFAHPISGKILNFEMMPDSGIFQDFQDILIEYKRSTNQK